MTIAVATAADLPVADQDDLPLVAALAGRGVAAERVVWNDPEIDWSTFDAVVIRSTWDYTDQRDTFVSWATAVGQTTRLFNPAEVVRWNTHKGYLMELEERGVPVVPTAWLAAGAEIDLAALAASRRWDHVVVKPAVGAGARRVAFVTGPPGEGQAHLDALLAADDVMVQPLLRRVATEGELSVVCIDGRVSHAVRKTPVAGDLRIHVEFGGTYAAEEPDDEVVALAEWVVECVGHDLLYARVDLVPAEDGTLQVSELEATEPSLYLDHAPGAADRLAAALLARL